VNENQELNQPGDLNQPDESFAALEQSLTAALERVDPPEGFADRVMARTEPSGSAPAKVIRMKPRRVWASGAIAAAVLVGAFTGEEVHLRHQRERAELAQRQFETAMRITDQTLERVRQQLQQAGLSVGN